MIRKFALLSVCALLIAACGRDEAETASPTESPPRQIGEIEALFDRIDADTPWLIANLETLPENVSKLTWEALQLVIDQQTYSKVAEELEDAPLLAAILRELAEIDSREAFDARGLEPNGHWALHAVSLYPFMHWELSDPTAFRTMLERIAADADAALNWRQIDDKQVLWAGVDALPLGLALAYDERYVTIAFVPDNAVLLRRVANLEQPTNAYDPATLERFSSARGYTNYGSGFIEFGRVLDRLLDRNDDLLAGARRSASLNELATDEICRRELGALVDLFPRASLGYTEIDGRRMAYDMTLEAEADLARRMRVIADTPVNLSEQDADLLSLGLAFNIVGARDFAREVVAGWAENPPQCSLFENIRENAAAWQQALNQPIPPVVTNFYGLRLNLDSLSLGENASLESAVGTLALFMRNPQMMLGMAQMFSPELAAVQLEPGGEPQPVPAGLIPNLPADVPAWMALGDLALGLAVGEDRKDRLRQTMDPGGGDSAIFSYGIDFAGYATVLDEVMASMREKFESMDEEIAVANPAEAMRAMAEIYESTHASVHLTERGIEFRSSAILRD